MRWQEVCDNPFLRDLPFKIETNRWGHIVMSPASNQHGLLQALLVKELLQHASGGTPITECSIQTTDGVKVTDVAWASHDFLRRHGVANPYPESPEIVVEILSPSNSAEEMLHKKELYFARGAREFWLVEGDGRVRFFNNHQELNASMLAPALPAKIELKFT